MAVALTKVGVVHNPRSHANRQQAAGTRPEGVLWVEPATPQALAEDMRRFAADGVGLVVIDGGDGTVREVLTVLPDAYGDQPPVLAILASGKTNILALDLGARRGWDLDAILSRAAQAQPFYKTRTPLEVSWTDAARHPVRGFVFGLGAFVRATQMSQSVHRMGAYHSLSVALTLAGAAFGTLFGGRRDQWRQGVRLTGQVDDQPLPIGERFVLMATTLKRLPFGLKPFGPPTDTMKVLDVDSPPRLLLAALPTLLAGRAAPWLGRNGYRRQEAERLTVSVPEAVIVDGEVFPGGELLVRRGAPMRFLAP